jgi:hypothetical protein
MEAKDPKTGMKLKSGSDWGIVEGSKENDDRATLNLAPT